MQQVLPSVYIFKINHLKVFFSILPFVKNFANILKKWIVFFTHSSQQKMIDHTIFLSNGLHYLLKSQI